MSVCESTREDLISVREGLITLTYQVVPRITAWYGQTDSVHKTPHTGVDIAVPTGTELHAPVGGTVSRIVDYGDQSLGKAIFVKTDNGYQYIVGHLSKVKVTVHQHVDTGQIIALTGNTGNSTGPHVHLGALDQYGHFMNPIRLFSLHDLLDIFIDLF